MKEKALACFSVSNRGSDRHRVMRRHNPQLLTTDTNDVSMRHNMPEVKYKMRAEPNHGPMYL